MESHVTEASSMGLEAVQLPSSDKNKLKTADILFASPEFWTSKEGMTTLDNIADRVIMLATDEVHLVPKWGTSEKEKDKAFREAFAKIRNMRSIVKNAPMLALTATASAKTIGAFQRQLGMRNVKQIIRTPDRRNIHISVTKVMDLKFLLPVIDELKDKGVKCERTVIYCRLTQDCSRIYQDLEKQLGDDGYLPNREKKSENRLFCMYFNDTLVHKKSEIVSDLLSSEGHFRVIVAINALGLGINMADCTRVFHYGVPRAMEDYVQEIGRAGRNGEKAKAHMYYKAIQVVGCNEDMKKFIKSENTCRRSRMLNSLGNTQGQKSFEISHECCDICSLTYKCGE